ncbi:non-hydrolyzing UDP-N-acetylglucosamine 2-epimerase [Bradyrhizobium lablabi]|uniref:non-hydrolyzing UDP-N-acetylglucosamine 2-epimerase n=1 Tax=Bradyrhizobium lablabi TaxID=722472 RepID=UPI000909A96D|nr:UDP-N-acetylglucosamine 2-epimerase (non-hydrolyzing) [Bradyrhizobium lablabi]SHM80825.1 UDP-N-acetylglucosamine 2-epimerase (non-hydrolysing) [Bradyrhizobium lablabi]
MTIGKLKVVTVIGTRPEIIRLSRVIAKLDQFCDHTLVHTGQNYDYELNEIFFEDLGIRKPDVFLGAAGATAAETIGNVIIATDRVLAEQAPEALLVLGDTNSSLAVIAAKRRRIAIFHMEAGNRSFDDRVPEEINRRIVDHTADINLTYSTIARDYLLREGLAPDRVIKTGSPMFEVLEHYRFQIDASDVRRRLGLESGRYFLVSAHREENINSEVNFVKLCTMLDAIAKEFCLPIIVSTHPRTQNRIDAMGLSFRPEVRLLKPLGFSDYVNLQMGARVVLSDSGTITEEASILDLPALNIREANERPEGMEEGTAMMVGLDLDRVMQGITILDSQARGPKRTLRLVHDYAMPNVSDKVLRIIHSYTDYVKRVVWRTYG